MTRISPSARTGRKFTHSDGTAVAVTSPVAAVGSTVKTLTVPDLAAFLKIKGKATAVRVGVVNPLTIYETHAAGAWSDRMPVADLDYVYFRSDCAATTTEVEFRFETV